MASNPVGVGDQFGDWVVLGRGRTTGKQRLVRVKCRCGNMREVQYFSLTSGRSTSCGCQSSRLKSESLTRHGHSAQPERSGTPEYNSWRAMRRRCTTPSAKGYELYGGRGISVCPQWDSFEQFLADMGARPPGKTLERVDINGGYCPENCVWADAKAQAANRRTTKHVGISWRGVTKPLADWARDLGMSHAALYRRIVVLSWGVDKAFLTPVGARSRNAQ